MAEKYHDEGEVAAVSSNEYDDRRGSTTEPQVGELRPGEAEAGGLGRHLGLFSTTLLMYTRPSNSTRTFQLTLL